MRYVDGQYYVAYTDPLGVGCCGKEDHFSIASSADLVHWTNLVTVVAGVPNMAHTWAPEWFVDGGTVNVIANIDTLNTDSDFKPYVFTALDRTLLGNVVANADTTLYYLANQIASHPKFKTAWTLKLCAWADSGG